eukprot:11179053-Lingulodinium_polyedra.AAC.1
MPRTLSTRTSSSGQEGLASSWCARMGLRSSPTADCAAPTPWGATDPAVAPEDGGTAEARCLQRPLL